LSKVWFSWKTTTIFEIAANGFVDAVRDGGRARRRERARLSGMAGLTGNSFSSYQMGGRPIPEFVLVSGGR